MQEYNTLSEIKREKELMAEVVKYGLLRDWCVDSQHDPRVDDLYHFQCIDCGALFTTEGLKLELILQLGTEYYREEYDKLLELQEQVSERKFEPGFRDPELTQFDYETPDGKLRTRYFYE